MQKKKQEVYLVDKKYAAGLLAFAVCIAAVSGAYAFGGFANGFQGNEAVKEALDSQDYEAFVQAVSSGITEEMFGHMLEMHQARSAVQQALENRDYEAWVQAIESQPKITDFVTKENFAKYAEMQEAIQSGDLETAQALAKEIGLDEFHPPLGQGDGHSFRMRKGFGQFGQIMPCQAAEEGS